MPTLHETQARMAAHLIYGGPTDDLMPLLADGAAALDIYRNTIESVLGNALRLTFPAVERIVGPDFFHALGLAFAREHPPASGCLDDWGAEFPNFVADFPPASSVPYVADVARLEWAIAVATAAPDTPSVLPEDAQLPLLPHPSFSLIAVDWPADAIRAAVLTEIFDGLKVEKTSSFLAIHRTTGGIVIRSLDRAAAAFTRALFEPDGLQSEPLPQHLTLLAEHLALGCFKDESHAEAD